MNTADGIFRAGQVVTCAPGGQQRKGRMMSEVGAISDGALAVRGGRIAAVGPADELLKEWEGPLEEFPDSCIVPGLIDCHTHPIFAGSRVEEFAMRANGASYEQIHAAGGGINSTVKATRQADTAYLKELTKRNLCSALAHGTTSLEAKSGYGLNFDEELRELRILKELGAELPLDLAVTFLGAHAVPPEYAGHPELYLPMLVEKLLPVIKVDGLAEWVDIFCEKGVFELDMACKYLDAALAWGFKLRVHAEEFAHLGSAVDLAKMGAYSVDHLMALADDDIPELLRTSAVCTLMPTTSFFLGSDRYAPGRHMIDAGLCVALGTDFNAGSTMSFSMAMAMSLAVLHMRFSPAEALIAATVNSAHALDMADRVGSLEIGKQADFLLLDVSDYREWPYRFGMNLVRSVYKLGRRVNFADL
ncbi:imidazolonepropionase [bacterium]|nr:imidazolonepropionase [bacterium]